MFVRTIHNVVSARKIRILTNRPNGRVNSTTRKRSKFPVGTVKTRNARSALAAIETSRSANTRNFNLIPSTQQYDTRVIIIIIVIHTSNNNIEPYATRGVNFLSARRNIIYNMNRCAPRISPVFDRGALARCYIINNIQRTRRVAHYVDIDCPGHD